MKVLFVIVLLVGLSLRINKKLGDHKFTKRNKIRLKRRGLLMQKELNPDWVDEFLEELFFKIKKVKQ